MPRVKSHTRVVKGKRIRVKGYTRRNPRVRAHSRKGYSVGPTHVKRHWRKRPKK